MDGERMVGGLRCSQVLVLLSDYLDGDLTPAIAEKVDQHLQGCPNCARFGGDIAGMLAALSDDKKEITPEIAARLKQALTFSGS